MILSKIAWFRFSCAGCWAFEGNSWTRPSLHSVCCGNLGESTGSTIHVEWSIMTDRAIRTLSLIITTIVVCCILICVSSYLLTVDSTWDQQSTQAKLAYHPGFRYVQSLRENFIQRSPLNFESTIETGSGIDVNGVARKPYQWALCIIYLLAYIHCCPLAKWYRHSKASPVWQFRFRWSFFGGSTMYAGSVNIVLTLHQSNKQRAYTKWWHYQGGKGYT